MNHIQNYSDVIVGKFGGNDALKDVDAIRNAASIVKSEMTASCNIMVVSAIGPTTRALECVYTSYEKRDFGAAQSELKKILEIHTKICRKLFRKDTTAIDLVEKSVKCTNEYIIGNSPLNENREQSHAKILSLGEVMSWHIVSALLTRERIKNFKLDSREVVKTVGDKHLNAVVGIPETFQRISRTLSSLESLPRYIVCQGFLGSKASANTTTLGKEGSDYSASVYAACCGGQVKFFKKYAYHDKDPSIYSDAQFVESITVDELSEDVRDTTKKPILHPMTLNVMKRFGICGEIISCSNLSQRTRVVF